MWIYSLIKGFSLLSVAQIRLWCVSFMNASMPVKFAFPSDSHGGIVHCFNVSVMGLRLVERETKKSLMFLHFVDS